MRILKKPDLTLVVLISLLVTAIIFTFLQGGGSLVLKGLVQGGKLFETIWLRLPLGFLLGGLIHVLVPRDIIARWLGPASGIRGILIGSYAGIIIAGAPFVMLPIIASLYLAGAGPGPIIALLVGQSLLGLQNLIVWQIPFLGLELPLAKYFAAIIITPLVGVAGSAVFKLLKGLPDLAPPSEAKNSGNGRLEAERK